MIYAFQLHLILATLLLAGKDATSYRLMQHTAGPLTASRIKRWHRDGAALAVLFVIPLLWIEPAIWWKTIAAALLIRLAIFDYTFNHYAGVDSRYLGGTAWADRVFVRIFGMYGAVRKSLTFFIIWIVLNLLNQFL